MSELAMAGSITMDDISLSDKSMITRVAVMRS